MLMFLSLKSQYQFIKHWDKRFGGYGNENLTGIKKAVDGVILFGGSESKSGGDKTEDNWDTSIDTTHLFYDWWILKLDAMGNKLWDKSFGGFKNDVPFDALTFADGSIVVVGYGSGGGNMTEPFLGGGNDAWIIKIDGNGNKLWDKRYGTSEADGFEFIRRSADGGYYLGSSSVASASFDKTEPNRDPSGLTTDYWVLKLDSNWNKQWDKTFGGASHDFLRDFLETPDGGFLFAGFSQSDSSGDKSQDNYGLDYNDIWIVKTDSLRNVVWDRRFGGTGNDELYSLIPQKNGQYLVIGVSNSDSLVGDKSTSNSGYWFLCIDSLGYKLWDKTISPGVINSGYMTKTDDAGFLLSGSTTGLARYEKSEDNLGQEQSWVIKLDSVLNKQWDKTIFTPGSSNGYALNLTNECYLVANNSWGLGGYKSQLGWDSTADYWLVKFSMDSLTEIRSIKNEGPTLIVYPNPFSQDFSINVNNNVNKTIRITLSGVTGQVIYNQIETNVSSYYTKILSLESMVPGIYFLEIVVDNQIEIRRIVKE